MKTDYQNFLIRSWEPQDRQAAAAVIREVLTEHSLPWQPETADRDVIEVEACYLQTGGEFWVVEYQGNIIATAAYYPTSKGNQAAEIRKMYILPAYRGKGLGKFLLQQLEIAIASQGFQQIWLETATVLTQAVRLYESKGYQSATGVETPRCDLVYVKVICCLG